MARCNSLHAGSATAACIGGEAVRALEGLVAIVESKALRMHAVLWG